MTISSEYRRAGPYIGDGMIVNYPFAFKVFKPEDLLVITTDANGVESELAPVFYSVALNPDQDASAGGSVTGAIPLPLGHKLTITSRIPYLQPAQFTNQGGFFPRVLNDSLDRVTIQVQQLGEQMSRAVVSPISSGIDPQVLWAQLQADANQAYVSAGNAQGSAFAASADAGLANGYAMSAANSEFNAGVSESNASGFASAASGSASAASGSASSASSSASAASGSASASEGSRIAAAAIASATLPVPRLFKVASSLPCLTKTGASTVSVLAGTVLVSTAGTVTYASNTAVTMPALDSGSDYSVWVRPSDSSVRAVKDLFSSPASAPVAGDIKIGGFHFGAVGVGETVAGGQFATTGDGMIWTQGDVDKIAGINEFSLWDLSYRPICDPRGMTCMKSANGEGLYWVDIYLCNKDPQLYGTSAYSTAIACGAAGYKPTIPAIFGAGTYSRMAFFEANEIAAAHRKGLPAYTQFAQMAFGVTEHTKVSATVAGRAVRLTSRIGLEQAAGCFGVVGQAVSSPSSGSLGTASTGDRGGVPDGTVFQILGGDSQLISPVAGSRAFRTAPLNIANSLLEAKTSARFVAPHQFNP